MKTTFKSNLLIGFGLSLLLLIVSSVASYFSIESLIASADWVEHTHKVINTSEDIMSNLKDGETGQRGYLLTKDIDFLQPFTGSKDRTKKAWADLKELTRDNIEQQQNCDSLEILINKRYYILEQSIESARLGIGPNMEVLQSGQLYMEKTRLLIKKMQAIEERLLNQRKERLDLFTKYTPVLIVVAALLAIGITIFFFRKVTDDFKEKTALNAELEKKDKDIADRLRIIQDIAQQVATGNYQVRVNEEDNDRMGSLTGSLNRMASSLDEAFNQLSQNEWLQAGRARLGEKIAGEKDLPELSADIIRFATEYTNSQTGAIYLTDDDDSLLLAATYAIETRNLKQRIKQGEGLAGQCFKNKQQIVISDIDEKLYASFSGGEIKPKSIIAFPIFFEGEIIGVMELGNIHAFRELDLKYLRDISQMIGIAVNTARSRTRLKELLEETQSQSEELQAQHRELENMNVELEAQAEKLQSSEEELKVQQEELMETNQALEERSKLLEEKNHLVAIRNLEIQKKAEELEVSTKYKSEFLANMSHELRTPLNSILLLSRLLSENPGKNLSDEQIEFAQVIRSSGNGLLQLIDEILDLSKIESGKLELSYETVALADISNELRMLFAPVAKDKNLGFTIHIDEKVPLQIETDKLRLEQVLKNLISNALKFTARGAIELVIAPSSRYKGFIDFSVKDTGIGIQPDKQEAIFEAFQQADGSTKRNYGGTGLGLSISRQLARLLSGDITLTSDVNKGSEFTLYIPATKPAPSQVHEELPQTQFTKNSTKPEEKIMAVEASGKLVLSEIPQEIADDRHDPGPSDKLLLIVEDDTLFAKALLDFIRQKGYKGIVLVRGDQALDIAKTYKPAGILLDIQLPVKDGLQVLDELKAHPVTRHIPVHIMSSFEVKKEILRKGAVDFITKPLMAEQMNEVLKRIESALATDRKKVLIVEDNTQHAKALAWFLSDHGITAKTSADIKEGVDALLNKEISCVILDMGIPGSRSYDALEIVKKNESLSNIPIIIFTGKSLSRSEEQRIKLYADSIVVKTAHSYQRILDEVSLFLHIMDESIPQKAPGLTKKMSSLDNLLKNKTVLVTDDDVRNIFALTKALEKHQMHVITTSDGKEALKVLDENPSINIVLMDMMMPEMDGYETIAHIRRNAKWKRLPVIAVTAKAMTGDREKCMLAGASDYITKPVDTDQLISLMRIWLQESSK